MRRFIALRLLLVVPLLIATLVLHLSGTDLVILRIARIILLAALVGGLAYLRGRKRAAEPTDRDDELGAHSERRRTDHAQAPQPRNSLAEPDPSGNQKRA